MQQTAGEIEFNRVSNDSSTMSCVAPAQHHAHVQHNTLAMITLHWMAFVVTVAKDPNGACKISAKAYIAVKQGNA